MNKPTPMSAGREMGSSLLSLGPLRWRTSYAGRPSVALRPSTGAPPTSSFIGRSTQVSVLARGRGHGAPGFQMGSARRVTRAFPAPLSAPGGLMALLALKTWANLRKRQPRASRASRPTPTPARRRAKSDGAAFILRSPPIRFARSNAIQRVTNLAAKMEQPVTRSGRSGS